MDYGLNLNQAAGQQMRAECAVSLSGSDTTVSQNIDNRISSLRDQIARLEAVKQKLSRGSILDVSLSDLQMAMGRY